MYISRVSSSLPKPPAILIVIHGLLALRSTVIMAVVSSHACWMQLHSVHILSFTGLRLTQVGKEPEELSQIPFGHRRYKHLITYMFQRNTGLKQHIKK